MNEILTATNLAYITVALAIITFIVYQIRKGNIPQILTTTPPPTPVEHKPEPEESDILEQAKIMARIPINSNSASNPIEKDNELLNLLLFLDSYEKLKVDFKLTTALKNKKLGGEKFSGEITISTGNNGEAQQEPEEPLTDAEIEEKEKQDKLNMDTFLEEIKPKVNGQEKTEKDDKPEKPDEFWDLNSSNNKKEK